MDTQTQVGILAVVVTSNEAGRHFTEVWQWEDLLELERDGLLEIIRPTHGATGIPYSQEHYSVRVTQEGVDLVEAWPEYCPE